jgi:hypothetical protein
MTRKLLLAAALATLALTSTIDIGTAQASWGGHPGWAYYHGWGPRYYTYYVPYYPGPRCYVTVYGTAYCY